VCIAANGGSVGHAMTRQTGSNAPLQEAGRLELFAATDCSHCCYL